MVVAGFEEVAEPVATAGVLADAVETPKRTVLRRLRELEAEGRVER